MAHSLRSKSKLRAKSVKRAGEFQTYVDERNKRINAKLQADLKKQKLDEKKKKAEEGEEIVDEEEEKKEEMDVDSKKKVSTSGWRESRHVAYKKRQTHKSKSSKHMKF